MDSDNYLLNDLIIGAGVAGLSAANHLAEKGMKPVIIDGGAFPAHKICGEFFSPDSHHILKRWDLLPAQEVRKVVFHVGKHSYGFELPAAARGQSRYHFDNQLLKRAEAFGAKIYTNEIVEKISYLPDECAKWRINLKSGKSFVSKNLYVGAGRVAGLLFSKKIQKVKYMGLKAHFEGIDLDNALEMFLLPGGYLGASPIEGGKVNIAGLFQKKVTINAGGVEQHLDQIVRSSSHSILAQMMRQGSCSFPCWMTAEIAEFKRTLLDTSRFSGLYLIGDAEGTIPPATGNGLGMAVISGYMAAEYSLRGAGSCYHEAWRQMTKSRFFWGAVLHWLMLNPLYGETVLKGSARFPSLFRFLFRKTRGDLSVID